MPAGIAHAEAVGMQQEKILCPVDFSTPSHAALCAAAALAERSGGTLTLLHVYDLPPVEYALAPYGVPQLLDDMRRDAEDKLGDWQREAMARGALKVDTAAVPGSAAEVIVREARARGSDLVVVGTHGRTGLRHALLGSVAERIVQRAPCPVLVARGRS
jgi:nucleotide-binding universal stress UspA family protein